MSSDRELPPKSLKTLGALEVMRMSLHNALRTHCIADYVCHDRVRAKDFLRSYACSIFDFLKEAYSEKISIWEWETDIADEAVQITISCWANFGVNPPPVYWAEILHRTIIQHVGRPLRGRNTESKSALTSVPTVPAPPQVLTPLSIGEEIRRLLEEARLRPEDIAEHIGIEARNVYRHLAGETVPTLVNVGKYESVLTAHLKRPIKLPTPVKRRTRQ